MNTPVVAIEGPLGVGKSTLVNSLRPLLEARGINACFVPEAVAEWKNWHGEDVLGRAIHTGDNLFFFQTLVLSSYNKAFNSPEAAQSDIIITERSPHGAANVFVPMAYKSGKLSVGEYELLQRIYTCYPKPCKMIALWSEHFPSINERVVMRDGNKANWNWTRAVYDAYSDYYAKMRNSDGFFSEINCFKSKMDVAEMALECIEGVLNTFFKNK